MSNFKIPSYSLYVIFAMALLLAFIPYLTVLTGSWNFLQYDDFVSITNNPHIQELSQENLIWMLTGQKLGSYEPLSWLIKALVIHFFGQSALAFHITAIIFHFGNSLLIMIISKILLEVFTLQKQKKDPSFQPGKLYLYLTSASIGLLYAIHPLRTEVIVWASGQAYSVGLIFLLLSLLCFLQIKIKKKGYMGKTVFYFLSLIFYTAAIMGKSATLMLPFVLCIIDLVFLEKPYNTLKQVTHSIFQKIPFFAIGILAFYIINQANSVAMGVSPEQIPWTDRFGRAIIALYIYPLQTLWPFLLSPNYPLPGWPIHIFSVVPITLITISMIFTVYMLKHFSRFKWVLATILAYVVIMTPVLGFVQRGNIVLHADRYSYIGIIPLYLLAAGCLYYYSHKQKVHQHLLSVFLIGLAILFGYLTTQQIKNWRSDDILWQHALSIHPHNAFAANNIGFGHFERKNYKTAKHYLEIAYKYNPSRGMALNLGALYYNMGYCHLALEIYNQQLQQNPNDYAIQYNLANCLRTMGRFSQAKQYYQSAITLSQGEIPFIQKALQEMLNSSEYKNSLNQQTLPQDHTIFIKPKNAEK